MRKKVEKTYSDAAIENINEITRMERDLVKSDASLKEYELSLLTAIVNSLLSINLTLSGIADYYMSYAKVIGNYTREGMPSASSEDVERIINEVKNKMDSNDAEKFKEDQNGTD